MTKERLKEIMDELGMIDDEDVVFPESNKIIKITNFVEDLTLFNDLDTVKKLLVAIMMEVE